MTDNLKRLQKGKHLIPQDGVGTPNRTLASFFRSMMCILQ